jgi:hypothetical protein
MAGKQKAQPIAETIAPSELPSDPAFVKLLITEPLVD